MVVDLHSMRLAGGGMLRWINDRNAARWSTFKRVDAYKGNAVIFDFAASRDSGFPIRLNKGA